MFSTLILLLKIGATGYFPPMKSFGPTNEKPTLGGDVYCVDFARILYLLLSLVWDAGGRALLLLQKVGMRFVTITVLYAYRNLQLANYGRLLYMTVSVFKAGL